jgi:hypothetical protein
LLDDQAAVLDLQQAAALSDGTRFRRRDAELEPQRCGTGGNDLAGDVRGLGRRPEHVDQPDLLDQTGFDGVNADGRQSSAT